MNSVIDNINKDEYIYSATTKWGLKKYVCNISYYTEEPLGDLYYVICSILDSNDGCYDKRSLGLLLGFNMINSDSDDKYYDVAEVRIFDDILSQVEDEHLIEIVENEIVLTKLGEVSFKRGKHFRFFHCLQNVYEHLKLKSEMPTALLMFPFYKDMGIYTCAYSQNDYWPNDPEIENIFRAHSSQLIKRIELHSKELYNIYDASLQEYFDIETRNVEVDLYSRCGQYYPIIKNGEHIAEKATSLIEEAINEDRKEDIILECLFKKLWDDKNSILDYQALEKYLDIVNYEELTKDSRVVWTDNRLFEIIIERANQVCWRNITRFCDVSVLCDNLQRVQENVDWAILTERVEDSFLLETFLVYPWDLEIISHDYGRQNDVIEKLILLEKETEEEWDWNELDKRLTEAFVLTHLNIVHVNLAKYTNDTPEVRKAILSNVDKKWDWEKVENEFDIQFIISEIKNIGGYLPFTNLLDRVFTDAKWSYSFVENKDFKQALVYASKDNGPLSSTILNDKDYIWSYELIDLLSECGLISWESTEYMLGFECNPHIVWTKDFFSRYSQKITTKEGKSHLSQQINDIAIILNYPDYDWDWDMISANVNILEDIRLYNVFGDKLNWTIVLNSEHNIQFLQSIDKIGAMIGTNADAWTSFSAIADIEYVIKTYKGSEYPWNWTVLTERMFKKLKFENIGNPLFVNKWDWKYLSENLPIDFLLSHLNQYKNYFEWSCVFPRILTDENRLNLPFLDELASTLTNISGNDKCKSAWTALTSQYTFQELKFLIKETVRKRFYWWDMNYFCQHRDFNVFRDLDDCRNIVDWNILSASSTINQSFQYSPKLKIKEKAWNDDIRKILSDTRNQWDFKQLSHFDSLYNQRWFISQYKDKLDWEWVSQYSKLLCVPDKQKLNDVISEFKKYVDCQILSKRDDINIEQVIRIYPSGDYDYNWLIKNDKIKGTIKLVEQKPDYDWDWYVVSSKDTFIPDAKFIYEHIASTLNWNRLSEQDNQSLWGNKQLIKDLVKNCDIFGQLNWYAITSRTYFPVAPDVMSLLPLDSLNWNVLSSNGSVLPFALEYREYINWTLFSDIKNLLSKIDIDKFKDYLDWSVVCGRDDFKFSNDILNKYADYIDWNKASASLDLDFSIELVEKYNDKWNWPTLVKNKAFHNRVDVLNLPYASSLNVVEFINQFKPYKPKAYHFTHMSNAVKIIRAMKLQSRNYAEGNFSNSAGSNVYRTDKAHRFARFYFAPKSPTQFYNECLGKDSDDHRYYERALGLGLPKCPMPVFFVFDIEELLTVFPNKCYYSTGNMQKDSTRCYKVIEDPCKIKAKEIYINSKDTFDERQQEFLVDGELDFSKLKNVKIVCYDKFQESLLRKELIGSKWVDALGVNSSLYEYSNKELSFRESDESIRITTDYVNAFEFKIAYDGPVPSIINRDNVLRQRGQNIFVSSSVEINKDVPFEVYFEVNTPRFGSWLIYKNR